MTLISKSLETQILAKWHEFDLFKRNSAKNEVELVQTIRILSNIILKVVKDFHKLPRAITYRVVEFGCGSNLDAFFIVVAIALIYKKAFYYVGIDVDDEAIARINHLIKQLPDSIRESCQFKQADGSKIESWNEQLSVKSRFHAAIFIRPRLEDIYWAMAEYSLNYRTLEREKLRAQFYKFLVIFNRVLKECFFPKASLLILLCFGQEYDNLMKALSPITDAKDLEALTPHFLHHDFCLAVPFTLPEE